jgi:hypothetical protein
MAYQTVGDVSPRPLQPAQLENIELDTQHGPAYTKYAPPPGHPPDSDWKFDEDDKKPFFRSTSTAPPSPWDNRPVQAQQVATVTPLRAGIGVFDAVLASTPLMFIGKLFCNSNRT